jgi:hypothetical protein
VIKTESSGLQGLYCAQLKKLRMFEQIYMFCHTKFNLNPASISEITHLDSRTGGQTDNQDLLATVMAAADALSLN